MKAVVYHGLHDVRVENVRDPSIKEPNDCIIKVTKTSLGGSDMHLYNGLYPGMKVGDVMGHEFVGTIVQKGPDVKRFAVGDRVVVPFCIADGRCRQCRRGLFAACDSTNPHPEEQARRHEYPTAALYGYSHLHGGIWGGQAEYVRVLYTDANAFKIPDGMTDEQALFLTDNFPTGYMAVENVRIPEGGTIAIWGAGPVGQLAIKSAFLQGVKSVVAIDAIPERLLMAAEHGATVVNYETEDAVERVKELTMNGPDGIIDAVGMEAHHPSVILDALGMVMQALPGRNRDRMHALYEIMRCARPGTTVSIPGVYGGNADNFPIGMAFIKGLTIHSGLTHVHRYVPRLMEAIMRKQVDPTTIITHRLSLNKAPEAYKMFNNKADGCVKVVFTP